MNYKPAWTVSKNLTICSVTIVCFALLWLNNRQINYFLKIFIQKSTS